MASNKTTLPLLLFLAFMITSSKANLRHHHHHKEKETTMTLYFQDYSGGPNPTVIEVPGPSNGPLNFTKFGGMFCSDDPITKEKGENSTQIARGQGLSMTSALDGSNSLLVMSVVFIDDEYKGSTLELQGSFAQFEPSMEVAVVGGTGKFRLARGYATFMTVYYDSQRHYAALQCNITVLHY